MVVSLKANKKRILAFLVLAAIVVAAAILVKMRSDKQEPAREVYLATNDERVTFLKSFGWEITVEPAETREVMIPENFNDVYTTYNEMQKLQGFDLKPFAGYRCMQYRYKVNNYPNEAEVYATLLVYDKKLLGGDLACAKVNGFMHGFASDSAHYGKKAADKSNTVSSQPENQAAPNQGAENSAAENTSGVSSAADNNAAKGAAADPVDSGAPVDADAYPTD